MKKLGVLLVAVMALAILSLPAAAAGNFVTIVTGSTGGTYYPVGTILAWF